MKDTLKVYLAKITKHTKKLLISSSIERTTQREETMQGSLKSDQGTSHKKGSHPTSSQKSKKRRLPFIAFAFVLVFTSLCVLSLVGPQALVSAAQTYISSSTLHHTASTSLDASPTSLASCIETNCYGAPPASNAFTGPILNTKDCNSGSKFTNASSVIGTSTNFCADPTDFLWGNLDITCVYNDNLDRQLTNFNNDQSITSQGHGFGPWWVNGNASPNQNQTPVATQHTPPTANFYNQNTCVPGHQCRTNNASGQDEIDTNSDTLQDSMPAKIGGDDVVCLNDACAGITLPQGADTGASQGNVCGSGIGYDKLACTWIDRNWYYNPTAYAPDGAVEVGTSGGNISARIPRPEFLKLPEKYKQPKTAPSYGFELVNVSQGRAPAEGPDGTLNPSSSDPRCNTPPGNYIGTWTCDAGSKIVLMMNQGQSQYDPNNVFQNDPKNSTSMVIEPIMKDWVYPPTWSVMCIGTGDGGQFPCSDIQGVPDENAIRSDWLSGDPGAPSNQGSSPGHIALTYNSDTTDSPVIQKVLGITVGIGFALLSPVIILIGYQLLWASWTLGRATAMESFGRMILSIVAIWASFTLAQMLMGLANMLSIALVNMHQTLGYPQAQVGGQYIPYTLQGEDPSPGRSMSFRGVVVPVSRWGCMANDFVAILSEKFWGDVSGFIPFVGGVTKFAVGLADAVHFARSIGEFGMLIFSINLFVQIVVRIILINYYILTGPIVFACWGLPGGTGQKVVGQWFKGLASLLANQVVQLFILTTLPFAIPVLPRLPTDATFGILNMFLLQLPPLIVLMATVRVPKMLGTGATKAIGQAGTVTAGAVAALGGAAYHVV